MRGCPTWCRPRLARGGAGDRTGGRGQDARLLRGGRRLPRQRPLGAFPTKSVGFTAMGELLLVGIAGFLASLVDGALGMGFGPTSSSILLASGISPAAASTTVNLAKVATGLVAGVSHWRFGNIDRSLVLRLAVPGAIGALVGTTVLVNVDGDDLRPVLAVVLLVTGLRILIRFSRALPMQPDSSAASDAAGLEAYDLRGVEVA